MPQKSDIFICFADPLRGTGSFSKLRDFDYRRRYNFNCDYRFVAFLARISELGENSRGTHDYRWRSSDVY